MSRGLFSDWLLAHQPPGTRPKISGKRAAARGRRLRFEPLEDRRLLTITVNTLVDENDGIAVGGISLRDAIAAAAVNETIDFAAALTAVGPATITLTHGELLVNKAVNISGPLTGQITVDASGNDSTPNQNNGDGSRVFLVDDGNAGTLLNVFISRLTITGGDTLGDGGGIFNRENLAVIETKVSGNAADDGGGLYNRGYMTLTGTTVSNNRSLDDGGGIANGFGRLTVADSTVSGNGSGDAGGGIVNVSDLGGLHNVTIRNSTVSGNSSGGFGGGAFNFSGITIVEFSTITNNSAPANLGGGLATWGDSNTARTDVRSSIIAGNRLDDVAHVTGLPFPTNTFNSLGYNLIGAGASIGEFNQTGDQINVSDARLAPLGNYGGSTETHALLNDSPAIDSGDPVSFAGFDGVPNFDQRGLGRIEDGDGVGSARLDIGSFENHAYYFLVDIAEDEDDGNYDIGDLTLREAIKLANLSPTADTILFGESLDGQAIHLATGVSLGELTIADDLIIDATSLSSGVTIAAAAADPTPNDDNGDGIRIFVVDDLAPLETRFVSINGLTLTGADYVNGGGAIYNQESLTLRDSVISGNAAHWGGGIYNAEYGQLTVVRSRITGNSADTRDDDTGSGGGVYNWGGTATILESTISGNMAPRAAGLRNANFGSLQVDRSTISNNTAEITGGGIQTDSGDVTVRNSTVSGNQAGVGGGFYIFTAVYFTTRVSNSTISGNIAPDGGGIYSQEGTTIVEFSTITRNVSLDFKGSGVVSSPFPSTTRTEFYSSIIAGNFDPLQPPQSAPYDVAVSGAANSLVSLGYNIVGIGGFVNDTFNQSGDQIIGTADPLLGPLADNGGPTMTHVLLTGSPAIDAGDPSDVAGQVGVPDFDQRVATYERVRDGDADEDVVIDIGAFEVQFFASTPALVGDYNLNGVVDTADYIVWRNTEGDDVAPYSGADGNSNGTIDGLDYGVWRANFGNTLPPGTGASVAVDVALAETLPAIVELASPTPANMVTAPTADQVAESARDNRPAPPIPKADTAIRPLVARDSPAPIRKVSATAGNDEALVAWLTSMTATAPRKNAATKVEADLSPTTEVDHEAGFTALDAVFASLAAEFNLAG